MTIVAAHQSTAARPDATGPGGDRRRVSRHSVMKGAAKPTPLSWPAGTPAHIVRHTLSWWDQSPLVGDCAALDGAIGTHLLSVTDVDTGERLAYVKVSFTTAELYDEAFPTPLHYLASTKGWCLPLNDRPATWLSAHLHARQTPASLKAAGRYVASYSLSSCDVPDAATIETDLAALVAPYAHESIGWYECYAVPFIAYSWVDNDVRRGGLASALYDIVARRIGADGKVLRASGCQSDAAAALWAHFEADPAWPTTTADITYAGATRTHLALDYRP